MIVFAKTRYLYDSYRDLWKLVEVSNFNTCFIDEIDVSKPVTYIVPTINGEFRPHLDNYRHIDKQAKIIWWNLERPVEVNWPDLEDKNRPVFACTKNSFDSLPTYVDQVWISDKLFAESMQSDRIRFVPMGSDAGIGNQERREQVYDFAHMSYLNGRRQPVFDTVFDMHIAPNAWSPEREDILSRSRCMVNIHQSDHLIGEPLRFAVAAANNIPLISETITEAFPMEAGIHYISCGLSEMPQIIRSYCNDRSGELPRYAENLFELLCIKYRFKDNVTKATE